MSRYTDTTPHYHITETKNPHLLTERQSATFQVEELTQFLLSGSDNPFDVNARRQLIRLAVAHPIHQSHLPWEYLTADEHYSLCVRKSLLAIEEANRLNIAHGQHRAWFYDIFVNYYFAFYIHTSMCCYAIENFANDEQRRRFLPMAQTFQLIASYAQTELGHGTDIRRLETEAVFDRATDSFVLNSPTLTAAKFWPGSMGKTANHVLLLAQLYTPDRNHPQGIQMFLVPIRDLHSHEPLPGVEVGEISTRFAHILGDNGFLRLTNVRIPRTHMLMKLAEVDSTGNFQRRGDVRLLYGTMVHERIRLTNSVVTALIHAITIAVRYSAVRFQGQNPSGAETRVLDYPLQQDKLLPVLATAYVFLIAFIKLDRFFHRLKANESDYFEQLPALHALSSGFKAYASSVSERLAQVCRISCGGHGFLVASGLVTARNGIDGACSAEGDNVVLLQQVARYLLKVMQHLQGNRATGVAASVAYLTQPLWSSATTENFRPEDYCRLFESRSQMLITEMYGQLLSSSSSSSPYEAFLKNSIDLVHMGKAHVETFVLRAFHEQLHRAAGQPSIASVLEQLFHVYAIYTLRNECEDFIRLKLLSAERIHELGSRALPAFYSQLRPNLVTLVDAFDLHDFEHNSCLGRYDGQVYEALMERAQLNPCNGRSVHPVWVSIKQRTASKL